MFRKILTIALVLSLSTPNFALAQASPDAVYDKDGDFVKATNGSCVRTKWQKAEDVCAPKVAAPAPAPVVTPELTKLVNEGAIVYFEFNKAELDKVATERLNNIISTIHDSKRLVNAKVAGHADRIGTDEYNQNLSRKRADNVSNYLIQKGNINSQVVGIEAFGENKPASAGNCHSPNRDKLISCLEQDRRVEIQVQVEK